MAKSSSLKNMLLTLTTVTLVASALLGGVYALTIAPIDAAMAAKTNNAIASVSPEFNNDPSAELFIVEFGGKNYRVYPAIKDGVYSGFAIETFASGFGGRILLMVGFNISGEINGISVLSHTETPGLGDKIEPAKGNFSLQFQGKNPESFKLVVKKDGGDVDAITASTITSRAYCDAVTVAWEVYKLCVKEKLAEEDKDE